MTNRSYSKSVFINYPVDDEYVPLFRALVFAILRCGFYVRCAAEEDDSSDARLGKILRMIEESRWSIHDLSRTEVDVSTKMPRFNMPFELGLFFGAKHFGPEGTPPRACLVFERTPHSYEALISDLKGHDIEAHGNDADTLICKVRNWLANRNRRTRIPGGRAISKEYREFRFWLPRRCRAVGLHAIDLTFDDFVNLVYEWLESD